MARALTPVAAPPSAEAPREDARARLVQCALRLFAQQGFSKTSTRELAEAAQVNVAAISYYFGDKAGLYRTVFFEPMGSMLEQLQRLADPSLPCSEALRAFYEALLEPLRMGDEATLCMKLHLREMLEPTGLWQEEISQEIQPMHAALVALLCRQFGCKTDAAIQRLAVCLTGMGVHLHVGRDVTDQLAPGLNDGPGAVDRWAEDLLRYGMAMIDAEALRRQAATTAARATRRKAPTRTPRAPRGPR
jgi:TetR/AcrR family transcriptional regulator, regulator of cefoperazone and chloramphenicol sensitivity